MKYRIKKVGDNYYPQRKSFIRWKNYIDYSKDIVCWEWTPLSFISGGRLPVHYNPYIYYQSIDEANQFIDNEKHINKIEIYNR